MNRYTVGIDPDSDKHGIAVYLNGQIAQLYSLQLLELQVLLGNLKQAGEVTAHIEDTTANNSRFKKSGVVNEKAATAVNRSIGKVQQAQIEVERLLSSLNISFTRHRISSAWKDQAGKKVFEAATGWRGNSNEDTRSAAFIGFTGLGLALPMAVHFSSAVVKSWGKDEALRDSE